MSGERIGQEPSNEPWQTPHIEAAPSFGPPQDGGEKKGRKRNKKKNRYQAAGQAEGSDEGRTSSGASEQTRPKLPLELNPASSLFEEKPATAPKLIGEKAFAAVEIGEDTIWERDKDSKDAKDSGVAKTKTGEEPAVEKAADTTNADAELLAATPKLETIKDEQTRVETPQPSPQQKSETEAEPARLIRGEERRYNEQPMQQQRSADVPPSEGAPEAGRPDEAAGDNVEPQPEVTPELTAEPELSHESSHDVPEPPPLPPDPMAFADGHRRRFWNEPPAESYEDLVSNHDAPPPVYDYNRIPGPDDGGNAEAPIGTMAAGVAGARGVYESTIPPGLQRSASEARRNALLAFGAGWLFGRHGKNKAVRRERQAVSRTVAEAGQAVKKAELAAMTAEKRAANRYPAPRMEAEPLHHYQPHETSRLNVQPASVESRAVSGKPAAGNERKSPLVDAAPRVKPAGVAEVLAVPVAAAAAVAAFEKARPRRESEAARIPRAAKAAAARAAERVIVTSQEAPQAVPGARSERTLGKRELMKVAKNVKIDGVSIKEVFKANRIDEDGMRAVVETYLRGGDIRQRLAKEVAIKEQSYEIDPRFRRQWRAGEAAKDRKPHSAGRERLARVGSQAGVVIGHAKEIAVEGGGKMAAVSSKAAQSASKAVVKSAKTAQHDLIDNSNTNDWLSITAVVIVYAIILFMFFG